MRIREIQIRRMPGFPDGAPVLKDLTPGVNLVYGPNASGKTTTARAIQALIWPRVRGQDLYSLYGFFEVNGETWRVDMNSGSLELQRQGLAEETHPVAASAEVRDRYRLGLHELVVADNRRFAEAVQRESAGGYDLGEAARRLGFADRSPRRGAEYQALIKAMEQVRAARDRQEHLRQSESELADLENRRRQALEAQKRLTELEQAAAYRRASEKLLAAEAALAGFPREMARLAGHEVRRLDDLRRQIEQEEGFLAQARQALGRAEEDLFQTRLPEGGLPVADLETLGRLLDDLDQKVAKITELELEAQRWQAREKSEVEHLAGLVVPERFNGVDLKNLGRLADLARRIEKVRADQQALEAVRQWIGMDGDLPDPAVLREGLGLLERWLSDSPGGSAPHAFRPPLLFASGLALAAGLCFGFLFEPWYYALVAAGALLLAAALWPRRLPDPRNQREVDFERTSLTPPAQWTRTGVETRIEELRPSLAAATLAAERAQRWADLAGRRQQIELQAADLEANKQTLAATLGVAPEVDETGLFALVEGLERWQEAHQQALGALKTMARAGQLAGAILEQVNLLLTRYGYQPVTDRARARALVDDLARRAADFRQAEVHRRNALENQEQCRTRRQTLHGEKEELFRSVGLDQSDETTLRQLVRQRPEYEAAHKRLIACQAEQEAAGSGLVGRMDLLTMTEGELQAELAQVRGLAGQLADISQAVGSITQQLESARRGHDLEQALAREDDCRETLRETRTRDGLALAGRLLVEYLEEENRDRHLPAVFHRARRLFARITHGRYELEFSPREPEFLAKDTSTGLGHQPDQLSSATRLQLLLAVRLAFVEEQEDGPRLPLLLDETLANSDRERARAIIEAAVEICRDGRQVFYFTARPSEVAAWENFLGRHSDIPYHRVDLAALRCWAETERLPLPRAEAAPQPEIPEPGDLDHEAYGRLLNVPGFDPTASDIGGAHLWHFLEDSQVLCRMLRLGVNRWGQLATLLDYAGLEALADDKNALAQAQATARVLNHLAANWRIGRGRPVSRQTLAQAGLSEAFLPKVADLAETLGGDPGRLLKALEDGQVKRFSKNAREKLREYLEENGFLDQHPPLSRDQLRLQALAAATLDLKAGHLTPARIDTLLARLPLVE